MAGALHDLWMREYSSAAQFELFAIYWMVEAASLRRPHGWWNVKLLVLILLVVLTVARRVW
jgi:hypothetical protein